MYDCIGYKPDFSTLKQVKNRDIGVVLYTGKLQIHIQGPYEEGQGADEIGPYFFTDTGVTTDLNSLALDAIDEAYGEYEYHISPS